MAEKKASKKTETKTAPKSYAITKSNGKVIYRDGLGDIKKKRLKAKGWKVEEVK